MVLVSINTSLKVVSKKPVTADDLTSPATLSDTTAQKWSRKKG